MACHKTGAIKAELHSQSFLLACLSSDTNAVNQQQEVGFFRALWLIQANVVALISYTLFEFET